MTPLHHERLRLNLMLALVALCFVAFVAVSACDRNANITSVFRYQAHLADWETAYSNTLIDRDCAVNVLVKRGGQDFRVAKLCTESPWVKTSALITYPESLGREDDLP